MNAVNAPKAAANARSALSTVNGLPVPSKRPQQRWANQALPSNRQFWPKLRVSRHQAAKASPASADRVTAMAATAVIVASAQPATQLPSRRSKPWYQPMFRRPRRPW